MRAFFAILLLAFQVQAHGEAFFKEREDGWFWYRDPVFPEKETPKEEPPPPRVNISVEESEASGSDEEKPPIFSVAWIRQNLDKLKERAIDDPTEENVAAYLYAQRVVMDKADEFSRVVQKVVQKDPLLDENNRFPFATAFRSPLLRAMGEAREEILKAVAQKAGLFFFFRSDCRYCHLQIPTIKRLADRYGFVVKPVSIDGKGISGVGSFRLDQGQAKRLGIQVVPSLVLAIPPDTFVVMTQGFLTDTAVKKRILLAAEDQGLLSREDIRRIRPFERGLLDAERLRQADSDMADDPKAWVKYLREAVGAEMGEGGIY